MNMHLVLQAPALADRDIEQVARLAGARQIARLGPTACRLSDARQDPGIAEYCAGAKLDYGYVPDGRKLADMRLVVMDMDSTLISIECIDEIADMAGVKAEVSAITAAAMRGEIDYPESLQRRVRLLAALPETALARVYAERLRLAPGAETMLARMQSLGIRTLLVSGGFTFFTGRLQQRLKLDYTISNTLEIVDGKLTGKVLGEIVDAAAKAARVREIRAELGIAKQTIIAIGDGANDLKMMAEAGVSIAYHAKPVVREKADYALDFAGLDGVLNLFD